MAKLTDGEVEIEVTRAGSELVVKLAADQYELAAVNEYELFLTGNFMQLSGKIVSASEEELVLQYDVPIHAKSITEAIAGAKLSKRIEIARKFSSLQVNQTSIVQGFLHPDNLFLVSDQLYVAHRGARGLVAPTDSDYFLQYRALVLHVLLPKYRFEDLLTTKTKIKNPYFSTIWEATTIAEIEAWLDTQYHQLHLEESRSQQTVKKSRYRLFKFTSAGLGLLTLLTGMWLGVLLDDTVPRQTRIIEAQAAFVAGNFGATTAILSPDEPRRLPSSVQFMLATSHVELSTLSMNQRQAILNNLSPNSHENELLYWIYSGRGQLLTALDIAYSLGDSQLKLHAYAQRYDYINADMEMPGTLKQDYLTRYRRRLEELVALLEGNATHELPVEESEDE